MTAGDLDGDGDLELLQVVSEQQSRSWSNLTRHIRTPLLARPGHTFPVEYWSEPVASPRLVLPFLAASTTSLPVPPFGTLGLAAPVIALGSFPILPPAPSATWNLVIPNSAGLIGGRFCLQALMVVDLTPAGARLSNVKSTTVLGL